MGAFNIPLMVDHPQFETPLDAQKQVLGLKQLAGVVAGQDQSRQLGSQELLLGEQKLQDERNKQRIAEEDARDSETQKQLYADAVKSTPEGKKLDLERLRNQVAAKVSPRALQAFDKSVQEHAIAVAKMGADDLKQNQELAKELANHVNAVAAVMPGDTSPAATAARAAEWAKQVVIAKQNGLDPNNQLPTQYPGDDQLGPLDVSLRGTALHLADETARRAADTAAEDKKKKEQTQRDADRVEFGNKMVAAGVSDQESLDKFLAEEAPNYPLLKSEIGRLTRFNANKDTGTNRIALRLARGGQKGEDAVTEKTQDKTKSEVELALDAAKGDQAAVKALKLLAEQKAAASGGMSDAQQRLRDNDKQTRVKDAQKVVDDFQVTKDKAVADNEGLTVQLSRLNQEIYDKDAPPTPAKKSQLMDEAAGIQKKITQNLSTFKSAHEKQVKANQSKDQLQKDLYPQADAKPQAAPKSGPQKGEVRTKDGVPYEFDGGKWVLKAQ